MASATTVRRLVDAGLDYDAIATRLGITPGLAYLLATGMPADGSDAPGPHAHERTGFRATSQHLANPATVVNPTAKQSVLDWIRGRVESDEPMRRAAAAQDAAPPDRRPGEEPADLVDELTRDHNRVNALLKQLAAIPGVTKGGSPAQQSARGSIVDLITVELSRHEAAEEQTLWPLVRRALPDGDERAETALGQEQHGKDVLAALGTRSGHEEEFDNLVDELSSAAHKHVAFEEKVFLQLREHLDREELLAGGRRYVEARAAAPTRPHPHAPSRPPGVQVAGAAGALVDHARDALGDRPAERLGKPSPEAVRETEQHDDPRTED